MSPPRCRSPRSPRAVALHAAATRGELNFPGHHSMQRRGPARADAFDAIDTNGDGFIDKNEWRQAQQATAARRPSTERAGADVFDAIDTNGDGFNDKNEWR